MPYFSLSQISLGPITIYTWGCFLALAFIIGYYFFLRQAIQQDIQEKKVFLLTIFIFLGGVLGARLGYILQFPSQIQEFFKFNAGGLSFYGGFLGALIACWLYIKKANLNFWQIADILSPILVLGILITRIGCSLINDHQGAITSLSWAIEWPDGTFRHPAAEYLALNALIIFFVLYWLKNKFKKSGQLFIFFLIYYSASRFLLDFTRVSSGPLADPNYGGLFVSQWIGLSILILTFIYIVLRYKK